MMNPNDILNLREERTNGGETADVNSIPPEPQTWVYVICDKSDLESVDKIEERVLEAGCGLLSSRDYLEKNAEAAAAAGETHIKYLTECDAVLIYRNKAPIAWVQNIVADLRRIKRRREGREFRAQAIFCDGDAAGEAEDFSRLLPGLSEVDDYSSLSDLLSKISCEEIKPYPGLRPFEYRENYLFFGREGKAQDIAARLQQSRFVAVVGTSGSGKSSVVRAGLLPLLYGGKLYESGSHWRIAIMRPEETPIRNLAEALVYPVDFEAEEIGSERTKDETKIGITEAVLRRSGVGLLDFVSNPANNFAEGENLLIVVDQFEELFRFREKFSAEHAEEAAAFVKLLLEGARDGQQRIFVIITMRSDFLGDCAQFRDLPEAINDGQYLIPQMTREHLRQSIESPALVGDSEVSSALVNRILNDLEDDQNQSTDLRDRMLRDQLPILQHALMRTWDVWKRKGDPAGEPISVEHYDDEEIGGIAHALSRHADEAYNELDEGQKTIAEKMFKCLTETDSENREIRRPAKIEEICEVTGAKKEEIYEIVEIFRREGRTFLMPPRAVPLTEETKIDISHESLIRNWETLRGWVRQESEDAWQYRRVSEDASLLLDNEGSLWSGRALELALEWQKNFKPSRAWASRYQSLSDEENLELTKLRKASPQEEEAKRREYKSRHFDEAVTFLKDSADREAEIKAREERVQQDKLNYERERAQAMRDLAAAKEHEAKLAQEAALAEQRRADEEHENAARLEKINDKLRRQKKILVAVSALSLLLMLTTGVAAFIAWRMQVQAKINEEEAIRQKDIAETSAIEAIKQKAIAISEKENAERLEKMAEGEKKEAQKQKESAEKEKQRAEEQKRIAEKNEKEALTQKQKAKDLAEQVAEKAEDALAALAKEKDAYEKLDSEKKINQLNLNGLFALENYDYDIAEGNFKTFKGENESQLKLKQITRENKVKNEWWANYNLAKVYQQQIDFDKTEKAFLEALDILYKYERGITKNINYVRLPQVYFLPASYKLPRVVGSSDSPVEDYKIITLRKFAEFYRVCALTPEKCFRDYKPEKKESSSAAAAVGEEEDLGGVVQAGGTLNDKSVELNKQSLDRYNELIKISKVQNDALYNADVQRNMADIYKDLDEYVEAKKKYEAALLAYDRDSSKSLVSLAVMKSLLETTLQQMIFESDSAKRKMDSPESLTARILEKTEKTLMGEGTDGGVEILYNKTIGETYSELAGIYRSDNLSRPFRKKIGDLKRQHSKDKRMLEIVDAAAGEYGLSADKIQNLSDDQKKVWTDLRETIEMIYAIDQKRETLSTVAERIKYFNDYYDDDGEFISRFILFESLASAYAENDEYCKALRLVPKIEAEGGKSPLSDFSKLAGFYQNKLNDYGKASEYYRKWADAFNSAPDSAKRLSYIYVFDDAGKFYMMWGKYAEAREMFTEYSKHLATHSASSSASAGLKSEIQFNRIYADIFIGQTFEEEGNFAEATAAYEKSLLDLHNWRAVNKSLIEAQKAANTSMSNRNTMVAVNSTNTFASNSNSTANVNIPGNGNVYMSNMMANSPLYGYWGFITDKDASVYQAHLRVRLADLYTGQNKKEKASEMLKEETRILLEKYSTRVKPFILKGYVSGLKNIALMQEQGDQRDAAVETLNDAVKVLDYVAYLAGAYDTFTTESKYIHSRELTGEYYADYIGVLKDLKKLKGESDDLTRKINELEEKRKEAASAVDKEKPVCEDGRRD